MNPPAFCIVAIDPGLTGAVAFYFPAEPNLIAVEDMPVADGDVDPSTLARRFEQLRPDVAIVERVGAMPGQGVSSMFRFGRGYGTVLGVLAALKIETHLVTPGRWKKHFRLSADKEEARSLALRLWPGSDRFARKKDAGRAEAALIARFHAETALPVARAA